MGSDGNKVGKTVAVHQDHIVIEKGFFFPTSAITNADGDHISLNVAKDQALDQGWDQAPPTSGVPYTGSAAGYVAAAPAVTNRDTIAGLSSDSHPFEHEQDTQRTHVHEETLSATKTDRQIGEVGITKDVVSEQRTLDVPVTEERVRVSRVAVDRDASGDDAFQEGTIAVPIRGEEVQLQKQTRVAEEIEVEKEAVQRTEQVGGTVRREQVRVEENVTGGGNVSGSTTDSTREDKGLIDRAVDSVRDTGRNATN